MADILIVEDERSVREGLVRAMESAGHIPTAVSGIAEARTLTTSRSFDCILLDIRLRDGDGLVLLGEIRASAMRDTPVVMVTAYGDSERTIEAMKRGAFEYLTKPFDLNVLLATIERAVKQRALTKSLAADAVPVEGEHNALIGTSAAMLAVWKLIGRAAGSDAPVLITGETGTGKELVASAIHQHAARSKEPFVAVNLAALPPTLIESELLGHEKGSFTGAAARRIGRIEQAANGTLFLDEIGDLDAVLQTKLLRVLQDGQFQRVGGNETLTNHARVIAATNKPVRPNQPGAMIRDDLYYRLAVIEVEVPPLRARRSDVPLLVAHALTGTPARAVSEDAMNALLNYAWPGNVRELIHVVQRAAVMCGGEVIDAASLPEAVRSETAATSISQNLDDVPIRDAVAALEKRMILRALERSSGNRAEAARMLGIARPQLYTKMEEHGIPSRKE